MTQLACLLLITEDNSILSDQYKSLCEFAVISLQNEVGELGWTIEATIHQAYELHSAEAFIRDNPGQIDFASLDLSLSAENESRTELEGLRVIGQLNANNAQSVNVFLTSERRRNYREETLTQFQASQFFKKDNFDIFEYQDSIKCAVWLKMARRLQIEADQNWTIEHIDLAKAIISKVEEILERTDLVNLPVFERFRSQIDHLA